MSFYDDSRAFSVLQGKTLTAIKVSNTEVIFTTSEGDEYKLYHEQDCCETVELDDVIGDWDDLIGEPLLVAEELSNKASQLMKLITDGSQFDASEYESFTWTFYHMRTRKGTVMMRWLGTSNGYYSEDVHFVQLNTPTLQ